MFLLKKCINIHPFGRTTFYEKKVRIFLVFNINVTATLYFTGIPTARHLYHFFLKSGTQPEPSMVPFGKRTTFCTTFSKPARMVTRCQKTYYLWGLQEIFILYLIKCVPFSKKSGTPITRINTWFAAGRTFCTTFFKVIHMREYIISCK